MSLSPEVIVTGLDVVIEKDIKKSEAILRNVERDITGFKNSIAYQGAKKQHYKQLVRECEAGNNTYNIQSLKGSIQMINIDLRKLSDGMAAAHELKEIHTRVIAKLSLRLDEIRKQNLLQAIP